MKKRHEKALQVLDVTRSNIKKQLEALERAKINIADQLTMGTGAKALKVSQPR